jgi:hypothetical protein
MREAAAMAYFWYCLSVCPVGLRNSTKKPRIAVYRGGSKWVLSKYEGMLTTTQHVLVSFCSVVGSSLKFYQFVSKSLSIYR